MLYDESWGKVSTADFIDWMETKNPDESYDPANCNGGCLMGRYMAAKGIEWGKAYLDVANKVLGGRRMRVLYDKPHTFGGALKRVKSTSSRWRTWNAL